MPVDLNAGPEILPQYFLAGKTTVEINVNHMRKDFRYTSFDYFPHLHSYSDVNYSVTVYNVQHIKPFGN